MFKTNQLSVFLTNFLISGFIIGIASVMIEYYDTGLTGLLYGSLPIGFIYLLILSQSSKQSGVQLSYNTMIGGLVFVLYTLFAYFLLKYSGCPLPLIILLVMVVYAFMIYGVKNLI